MTGSLRLAGALIALVSLEVLRAQAPAPVPDPDAFLAATRENLARSVRIQDEFAYKERRSELHTNPFGRLGTGEQLLYEVTPLTDGAIGYTRRLLTRDGKPVPDAKVERIERRNRANPTRTSRSMDDVVSVLEFRVARREMLENRPAIIVTFMPRPNSSPQTRQGRLARSFSGQMWVDEQTREVTHVEATAMDAISYGFGILARLGKGTTVTLVREPVQGGVWLPTSIRFKGQGRALLFRKLTVDYQMDWFDYRRLPGTPG